MRIYKPRGLNIDESYACSRTAMRKCFEGQDLTVLWGNNRSFSFDPKIRQKPEIAGIIVADLLVSQRKNNGRSTLNFYIISDPLYGDKQKKLFEDACLPRMKNWLLAKLQQDSGCDQMIIAWTGSSFQIHELRLGT